MGWVVLSALAALILWDLVVHVFYARAALPMVEHSPVFWGPEALPRPDARHISFPTTNGLTLRGSLFQHTSRRSRGLIIFCHEFDGNHWTAMSYLEGLWKAGFDILAFDFRNQGESDSLCCYRPLHWLTDHEVNDVLAAIRFANTQDNLCHLPIGLFGVSKGGGAALAAAAKSPVVECVACDSAYSANGLMLQFIRRWAALYPLGRLLRLTPDWHIRLTLVLIRWTSQFRIGGRYTRLEPLLPRLQTKPVLMISGDRDKYVLPAVTTALSRRIGGRRCHVWVVPGARHNMSRQVAGEEYDERLCDFFSCLSNPPPTNPEPFTEAVRTQTA